MAELTIGLDIKKIWQFKRALSEWIILLGDKTKNLPKFQAIWKLSDRRRTTRVCAAVEGLF